jgi:hypothetical protein
MYFQYEKHRWDNYWILTQGREPIGYAEVAGWACPTVLEVGLPVRADAYDRLLAECGRMARQSLAREVKVQVPPWHPLGEYCRTLNASYSLQYRRCGGGMARILNLESWARKMCPEWSARLQASSFKGHAGMLAIECELGRVGLRIRGGEVSPARTHGRRVVKARQPALAQFTFGYRSVASARLAGQVEATDADAALLAALFPDRPGWVWPADRF